MRKMVLSLITALALTALCGCGAAGGEMPGIFYTRAATDEEAFSQILDLQDGEEIALDDGEVPLSGQPAMPESPEEGWLLVRYAKDENGAAEPLWYRVWSEESGWSQENLPYEGDGWHPVLPAPSETAVRPLG